MSVTFRCNCPITSGIDIIGDKWTLVLIKQMLLEELKTFKDFVESNEAISTNILTNRLKYLQELSIIKKVKQKGNKKSNLYLLTEKGLNLAPLIMELTIWSSNNIREYHESMDYDPQLEYVKSHKEKSFKMIVENYKKQNS